MQNARKEWSIKEFPAFEAGTLMDKAFTGSIGFHSIVPRENDYQMLIATDVEIADFVAYAENLSAQGFSVKPHADDADTILSYWITAGENRMYMYYTASTREARFILDQNDSVSLDEFEYTYEKKEGDNTTFYMYGLKMHPHGINIGESYPPLTEKMLYDAHPELICKAGMKQETYKNCGAMYVIKLADNSVMIVDGGECRMICVEQAIYLNRFLHRITDTPMNEKVRISAWFLTHPDGDHFTGLIRFLNGYNHLYTVERVMYNVDIANEGPNDLTRLLGCFREWNPSVVFHRLHTGEKFHLADMHIEVMETLEDLVRSDTMLPQYYPDGKPHHDDHNNTSVVLRLTIDGRTAMITGDTAGVSSRAILRNYAANDFARIKVDLLQIPHHAWNNIADFFSAVNPRISMINQSHGGTQRGIWGRAINTYRSVAAATVGGIRNIYYAGDETVGFEVKNGDFEIVFRDIAVGYAWDGSDGGAESRWWTWDPFPFFEDNQPTN